MNTEPAEKEYVVSMSIVFVACHILVVSTLFHPNCTCVVSNKWNAIQNLILTQTNEMRSLSLYIEYAFTPR